MKGRIEHRLKTEANIESILNTMPAIVRDYYYNISVSLEAKSCEEYIKKLRGFFYFLSENPSDIDVTTITETDISRYMHSIEIKTVEKNHQEEIVQTSFAYRQMVHSSLNSFFTYLRRQKKIQTNPVELIARPSKRDMVQRIRLTDHDIKKIVSCTKTNCLYKEQKWQSRDVAIITLFSTTGMRETALSEIDCDDIDFDNMTITVLDKRYKTHVYKIGNALLDALNDWLSKRQILLKGNPDNCRALFISNHLKRISQRNIADIVGRYSQKALGYRISPHKLRAAFCTILYDKTGDIEFVRDAVGHSSVSVTQRYIVKDDSVKIKSANIMDGILS